MNTKYKFIHFTLIGQTEKTGTWACRANSGGSLGLVKWYGPWRQYCFFSAAACVFNNGCLADIQDFIGQLTADRKENHDEKG